MQNNGSPASTIRSAYQGGFGNNDGLGECSILAPAALKDQLYQPQRAGILNRMSINQYADHSNHQQIVQAQHQNLNSNTLTKNYLRVLVANVSRLLTSITGGSNKQCSYEPLNAAEMDRCIHEVLLRIRSTVDSVEQSDLDEVTPLLVDVLDWTCPSSEDQADCMDNLSQARTTAIDMLSSCALSPRLSERCAQIVLRGFQNSHLVLFFRSQESMRQATDLLRDCLSVAHQDELLVKLKPQLGDTLASLCYLDDIETTLLESGDFVSFVAIAENCCTERSMPLLKIRALMLLIDLIHYLEGLDTFLVEHLLQAFECSTEKLKFGSCSHCNEQSAPYLLFHLPANKQLEICLTVLSSIHDTLRKRMRFDLIAQVEKTIFKRMKITIHNAVLSSRYLLYLSVNPIIEPIVYIVQKVGHEPMVTQQLKYFFVRVCRWRLQMLKQIKSTKELEKLDQAPDEPEQISTQAASFETLLSLTTSILREIGLFLIKNFFTVEETLMEEVIRRWFELGPTDDITCMLAKRLYQGIGQELNKNEANVISTVNRFANLLNFILARSKRLVELEVYFEDLPDQYTQHPKLRRVLVSIATTLFETTQKVSSMQAQLLCVILETGYQLRDCYKLFALHLRNHKTFADAKLMRLLKEACLNQLQLCRSSNEQWLIVDLLVGMDDPCGMADVVLLMLGEHRKRQGQSMVCLLILVLHLIQKCPRLEVGSDTGKLVGVMLEVAIQDLPSRYQLTSLLLILRFLLRNRKTPTVRERAVDLVNLCVRILYQLKHPKQVAMLPALTFSWEGNRDYLCSLRKIHREFVLMIPNNERCHLKLSELQYYLKRPIFVSGEPRTYYRIKR